VRAPLGFDVDDDAEPEDEDDGLPLGEVPEEEFEGGVPSAADALAVAWNASKLLFAVGLMAKTIPCSQ
jgi:hypothetical protein